MRELVKVLMDEQTQQALECLRDSLSEVFAEPVNRIRELEEKISGFHEADLAHGQKLSRQAGETADAVTAVRRALDDGWEEWRQDAGRQIAGLRAGLETSLNKVSDKIQANARKTRNWLIFIGLLVLANLGLTIYSVLQSGVSK